MFNFFYLFTLPLLAMIWHVLADEILRNFNVINVNQLKSH